MNPIHITASSRCYIPSDDPDYFGIDYQNLASYRSQIKGRSRQLRNFFETLISTLNSTGSLQFYGLTVNAVPSSFQKPFSPDSGNIGVDYSDDTGQFWPTYGSNFVCSTPAETKVPSSTTINIAWLMFTLSQIELLEFVFIVQELHKEGPLAGRPHYHVLFAVRCLLGTENEFLQASIQQHLFDEDIVDFQLRRLERFLDQKRFFNYMIKEERRHWQFFYNFSDAYTSSFFNYDYHLSRITHDIGIPLGGGGNYGGVSVEGFAQKADNSSALIPQSESTLAPHRRNYYLRPLPGKHVDRPRLEFLLHLACERQGYFYARGFVYKRNLSSRCSYSAISTVDELFKNPTPLVQSLIEQFPMTFSCSMGFVEAALLEHRISIHERALKNPSILLRTLELDRQLIEFQNGLYNSRTGQFLPFDENWQEALPINCSLQFPIPFPPPPPTDWLNSLRSEIEDVEEICYRIATLLHLNNPPFPAPDPAPLLYFPSLLSLPTPARRIVESTILLLNFAYQSDPDGRFYQLWLSRSLEDKSSPLFAASKLLPGLLLHCNTIFLERSSPPVLSPVEFEHPTPYIRQLVLGGFLSPSSVPPSSPWSVQFVPPRGLFERPAVKQYPDSKLLFAAAVFSVLVRHLLGQPVLSKSAL